MIPLSYRIAIFAFFLSIGALGIFGYGHRQYEKGRAAVQAEWNAQKAAAAREAARIDNKRDTVTAELAKTAQAQAAKRRTITQTHIVEVNKYVPAVAESCPLSPGFRVYHDAAAAGVSLPGPAAVADAAAVTPNEVARTVAANYGQCLDTADQLKALQEWVKAQGAVK